MATPDRATVLAAGFEIVMVKVVVPVVCAMLAAAKDLVIVGGETTVKVAEAVPPVPPLVELTAPVVFAFEPALVALTLTTRVQLELTASEPPVRLMLPAPAVAVNVPPQPLSPAPFGVATTRPDGNVSLTASPVCVCVADGLVIVRVRVDVPLSAMLVGLKALAIVGGVVTGKLAVFEGPPPGAGFVTITG